MDRTFYEFVLTSNTLIESQSTKKFRVPLNQIHYYELFSTRKVAIRGGCNGPRILRFIYARACCGTARMLDPRL